MTWSQSLSLASSQYWPYSIEILMTTTTQVTVFENNELRIAGETAEIKLLKFASVPCRYYLRLELIFLFVVKLCPYLVVTQ